MKNKSYLNFANEIDEGCDGERVLIATDVRVAATRTALGLRSSEKHLLQQVLPQVARHVATRHQLLCVAAATDLWEQVADGRQQAAHLNMIK